MEKKEPLKKSKIKAVISFMFGLTFWIPLLNVFFGIAAIAIGIRSLIDINRHPDKYEGAGFAVAGIVLGALPIVFFLIGLGMCLYGYKQICQSMGLLLFA